MLTGILSKLCGLDPAALLLWLLVMLVILKLNFIFSSTLSVVQSFYNNSENVLYLRRILKNFHLMLLHTFIFQRKMLYFLHHYIYLAAIVTLHIKNLHKKAVSCPGPLSCLSHFPSKLIRWFNLNYWLKPQKVKLSNIS